MRMRILLGGAAMSGPARMSNAVGAVQRLETDGLFEIAQLAFSAPHLQAIAVSGYRNSGGVIPPIFQPTKAIEDNGNDPLFAYVPNYAAHGLLPLSFL